jgi:hypothetical protein
MPAFESDGYADLRNYIQNNWTHISLVNDGGSESIRLEVGVDTNTSWSSDATSNPLEATLTITGSDIQNAGGSLPVTLTKSRSHKDSTTSTVLAEDTYTNATLEAANDELTVTHTIELPPQ